MSCHISALCIALPRPQTGQVETTFGERNSWRVETTSIWPPSKHQQHLSPLPPPCDGRGGGTFEESTFNVTPPVSHAEGGVQHLSLLRFMLERHTTCRRRSLRSGDLFSGPNGLTVTASSMEDQITGQKMVLCRISCLLHSWSKESQCPLISERLHTQVIDSELDLNIFSVGVLVTRA